MTKVIIFQGNTGTKYLKTRHNIGFIVADYFAIKNSLKWVNKSKFKAEIAELKTSDSKVLLVKPQTFYNATGESANELVSFYKINPRKDLLVVCDDLNLNFGTIRTRRTGSDGGNNGLKSIIKSIGESFARIRIGTNGEARGKIDDASFVLSKFTDDEWQQIPDVLEKSCSIINQFIDNSFESKKSW